MGERTSLLATDEEARNSLVEEASDEEDDNITITSHRSQTITYGTATTTATKKGMIVGEEDDDKQVQKKAAPDNKSHGKFRTIFTPQSTLLLLAYGMLAMHSMGFDTLFPVFLHHTKQDMANSPDVKLPFKFSSGFGLGTYQIHS